MSSCPSLHRKFDPNTGYSRHASSSSPLSPPSCPPPTRRVSPQQPSTPHNLRLESYSFDEILQMFGLTYTISLEDLKRAKRKVLMVHPDKSALPPDYFLFYKRAFELVVNYYQSHSRQHQIVDENTSVEYVPINEPDPETRVQFRENVQQMKTEQFQRRFNELFEQNMAEKPDSSRNEWFRAESTEPIYATKGPVNASNLNSSFDTIKTRQREQGIVRYTGVRELSSASGVGGSAFYDMAPPAIGANGEPEAADEDVYVSSDPFSKLKFEDLRKVHKDQTIFAVSESDYANVKKYANVEQYSRARSAAPLVPMEKQQAQQMLDERERIAREQQARKQHYMDLKMQEYAEKNKQVMGAFLHLENGRPTTINR